MRGRACQGVEQRHQQKHDVERQDGDGAAQHEGMRIILKCGWRSDARVRGGAIVTIPRGIKKGFFYYSVVG